MSYLDQNLNKGKEMENLQIIIIGLGGIGNVVADNIYPLVRNTMNDYKLLSMTFVDKDDYSESNIPRQKAAASLLGMNKAVAWEKIYSRSKSNNVGAIFMSVQEWVTVDTVDSIFRPLLSSGQPTVAISCVDNHAARLVLSRYAQEITKGCDNFVVIQAGCNRDMATTDLFGVWHGIQVGVPIEEGHPEVLEPDEADRGALSCEELANLASGDQTYVDNFMAGTMALNLLFTLLTKNGAKVLSRFIGETMICSAHYYSIERKEIKAPVEVGEQEEKKEDKGAVYADIKSIFPEFPDGIGKKIIDVSAGNTEHMKHIINFINSMKNISTVEQAVVDPKNRNTITEFINTFGDKGTGENVGFNNNELFAIIAIGKNLTGSDQTTLTRYLNMCNK
jgi:hypothetical protein